MERLFDATVVVVAPDPVRAERAGARGTSELAAREARQMSQDDKAARATYVVRNDGSLEQLTEELAAILPDIRAAARGAA
jgi:dephospho-CoA kinase